MFVVSWALRRLVVCICICVCWWDLVEGEIIVDSEGLVDVDLNVIR